MSSENLDNSEKHSEKYSEKHSENSEKVRKVTVADFADWVRSIREASWEDRAMMFILYL